MTTSVCMGTYNGENYIEVQLYSILHQTKTPDEVVICDDGSNDSTVEKIEKFIDDNHLSENWHLYRNEQNKGYPANFYYAMNLCTMDVVFLADQDDVWHEKKLEQMCKVLEDNHKANVVSCKFGLIDAEGDNIHTIMAPTRNRGTRKLRNVTIDDVFYKYEWPGMVVAYRNEWYRAWMSQNSEGNIPHDFLICAKAAEENGFVQIDEELAYHRRHDNNVGGEEHRIGKLLNKQRKLKEIEKYLKILQHIAEEGILSTEDGKKALEEKCIVMKGRREALLSGKISKVFAEAVKRKEEVRLATVLCDVLIVKMH